MTQPPPPPGQGPQQPGYGGAQPGYGEQPGFASPEPGYGYPSYPGYAAPPGYGTTAGLPGYPPPGQPYGSPAPYGSPYQPYPAGWNQYGYGKDPRLAEWWQRLVARILDGLAIGVLSSWAWFWAFAGFFHQISTIMNENADNPGAQQAALLSYETHLIARFLLVAVAIAVITFAYDWLQHGLWGQTLGKRAMGTVVVNATDWSKISVGAAAGRAAVYALPGAIPYAGSLFELLNELWLLWDQRRQCLHDKAAHTVVAKKSLLVPQDALPADHLGGVAYPGYPGYPGR